MLCFGYTKIKLTSNLSPEQYLARLAPVVQPPKPYEWAVMPKPDNERIIFEGRVTNNGFSLVRLQRQRAEESVKRHLHGLRRRCGRQKTAAM